MILVNLSSSYFSYMGFQEVVIMHWACTKIMASLGIPDANLLAILLDKVIALARQFNTSDCDPLSSF